MANFRSARLDGSCAAFRTDTRMHNKRIVRPLRGLDFDSSTVGCTVTLTWGSASAIWVWELRTWRQLKWSLLRIQCHVRLYALQGSHRRNLDPCVYLSNMISSFLEAEMLIECRESRWARSSRPHHCFVHVQPLDQRLPASSYLRGRTAHCDCWWWWHTDDRRIYRIRFIRCRQFRAKAIHWACLVEDASSIEGSTVEKAKGSPQECTFYTEGATFCGTLCTCCREFTGGNPPEKIHPK